MATVTKPIALDESFNTTEQTPRNIADVLAEGLSHITGRTASEVEYDNTDSGLTSDDVQGAIDELSERPILPSVDIQTAVDEFETYNGGLLSECKVSLTPNQDLHGYDSPWVGGASKQLYNHTQTNNNNILVTLNSEGSLDAVGTPSSSVSSIRLCNPTLMLKAGTYKATLISGNNLPSGVQLSVSSVIGGSWTRLGIGGIGETFTFTLNDDNTPIGVTLATTVTAGTAVNITNIKLLITADNVTDRTWCPYSNICPITGHTQVEVDVSDGDTTQEQVTVNLGGTYYSGVLDVVTGVFVADTAKTIIDENSAIYNWNSPQSPWCGFVHRISDQATGRKLVKTNYTTSIDGNYSSWNAYSVNQDIYVCMNENIIGGRAIADMTAYLATNPLEVVYELATPLTIQLSPTTVKALVGENHLSAPLEGQEITESKYKQMFTFDDVIAYIQSLS